MSAASKQLFEKPAPARAKPSEPIVRAADVEGNCRWTLSRRWSSGGIAAFVGCNPSYADAKRDDPTLWRVMGFAYRWGFGGLVMLNVHPFITPRIGALRALLHAEPSHATLIAVGENAARVCHALNSADLHVACWGNLVDPTEAFSFNEGLREIRGYPVAWHCLGTTLSGAPTLPMARGVHRVPDSARATAWRPNFKSAP
ncbi:MAG TPA: DUF1643 domain-containing protein [Stellaceae bacterium]|jgi:hypothetical protein|nr:DUF1643 domain-containing protein [Stellaceae bacterium]